jgi:ketosteroid isomerase-like protein
MSSTTQTLLDRLDVQETISRYHDGGSRSDWDQLIATFLPDAIWEVPAMDLRCEGQAVIRDTMVNLLAPIEYLMQINSPAIITIDGDSASARSSIRESAKFRGRAGVMDVVGHFDDDLRRTPEGWRFARRTFTILGTHMSAESPG